MRAAAVASASRTAGSSPASARSRSAAGISSAATLAAATRSKRCVYSSTAASPRARTSATIAATARSTESSWDASRAVSTASRASKPGARVESRAMSGMGGGCGLEGLDERLEALALQFERRLVDDQAARNRHDLLDRAQRVRAQRVAGGDEIHDRVGEPGERRERHRAVESDEGY